MASGRAIVGTRVGDVGDLVTDSENGFLVEPGDVEALAGALQSIVGDRALAQKLGMNGYEMCKEHFSSVKMIERLRDLYFEVIKLDQSQRTGLLSQTRRALK
jgi:glycogen(starch) synthase